MKIALIGSNGQLGTDLVKAFKSDEVIPLTHTDIEVSDQSSVRRTLLTHQPDVVINTAAFHRVDDCEVDPEKAFRINAIGAYNVALVARELMAKLVFLSTDYVFGGESELRTTPYTESDVPIPLSVYGHAKLEGEHLVQHLCPPSFVVRVSGLFGVAGARGKGGNFVETMIRMGKEGKSLAVVNDQVFSPTYTKDLAERIARLIQTDDYGIFHITNSGTCSWFEYAKEILRLAQIAATINPTTSDKYPQKAKRPHYSVLGNFHMRKLGWDDMKPWQEALADYLKEKGHIQ